MPVPADAGRVIADAVDRSAVVDTHEHIMPLEMLRDGMSFTSLLRESYLIRNVRAADGSAHGVGEPLEIPLARDTWETVERVIAKVRLTSYYRWFMRGVAALYDLPDERLTRDRWEPLSAALHQRYQDPTWLRTVLDRGRIRAIIWDPYWNAGTTALPDERFFPSLRINSSLVAFHPGASDFERSNLIRDWSARYGLTVDSLADLEELIEKVLEANIRAGCRSLKSAIAYDRTLAAGPAPRAAAARIFGTPEDRISPADRKLFGDYIVRYYLDRCREHGLVVQVHTGMARLEGSSPLLMEPLLQEFPDVVFDLFHGGYPWIRESAALAHNYPNVRLNLAWLPQLSTEVAVAALKEWLEVVPQIDRITWGSDCHTVEEAYGVLLGARHVVTRALTELVQDGALDLDSALAAADSVLCAGGARIYRV